MNPLAANESLQYMQKGAVAQAKALGCKIITLDDALNVDKQVSNMQQLLAQKVNAIIFYPLDPKATTPVLAQAKKAGRAGRRDRLELRQPEEGSRRPGHRRAGVAGP